MESRELFSTLPPGFEETLIATGVNPTGMEFAPDGRLFVASKDGFVSVIEPDGTLEATPYFSAPVDTFRDRGLTAVFVDPNYLQNHYVYVYYTAAVPSNPDMPDNGAMNQLIRLTSSSTNLDVADPASAVTILNNIPSPTGIHQGGFFRFGADGMLYAGIGESDVPENAQDLSNIYGKVLRLDLHDLSSIIPSDNPFVGQADKRPEIWAYGFRNPFSGNIKPGTNDVFVNDVGSDSWEEVDALVKGGNYGWPLAEGMSTDPRFINPIYTYSHNGSGAAVVGGVFYNGATFPASYSDQYFVADLVQGVIRLLDPTTGQVTIWASNLNYPTDLEVGPDGSMYWTSIGQGAVYKISYVGSVNRAPNAVATADVTDGGTPLTVNFDGTASTDPDDDSLTYSWDFGDGEIASSATVQHTYAAAGVYHAMLTVSDRPTDGLTSTSAPVVITVGNHSPQPIITAPLATDKYVAGQTISFSGTATDVEDGALPPSAFHWSFKFGHNTHFHDFIGPIDGTTSGSFFIPLTGETDPDQYYRIFLTVTDAGGLSKTTYTAIRPVLSTFTLASNVAGVSLLLDGQPTAAGTTITGVVNMTRTLAAPLTQLAGGVMYRFVGWSDGGTAQHTIAASASPTTYTAQYQALPLAAIYSSTAPQHVIAGQKVNYQVTVTNVGTQTWSATGTNKVRLAVYFGGDSDAVGAWPKEPLRFALPANLAPGKSHTFNVQIMAPATGGAYTLRDRMVKEKATWFDTLEKVSVSVETLSATYAATPPTIWGAGQAQDYTVTVTNTGTATWHVAGTDRVRLGVYFSGSGASPPTYFTLPNDVLPGLSATLSVHVVAPKNAGSHLLYNRLRSDSAGQFASLLTTTVDVQRLSAQYMVSPPTQWNAGEAKTYSITLVNNGSKTWNATGPNAVHLGVYFAGTSDAVGAWSEEPARFSLPHDVKPGQKVTLTISVTAPSTPGNYVLRHRMVKEFVNWFDPLQKTSVTVSAVVAGAVRRQ